MITWMKAYWPIIRVKAAGGSRTDLASFGQPKIIIETSEATKAASLPDMSVVAIRKTQPFRLSLIAEPMS